MKKIIEILLLLFGVIIIVLLATLVKQLNFSSNKSSTTEDPILTEIKKELIIPFCESDGNLTDEDLPKYFSSEFISFWNNTRYRKNTTAKSNSLYISEEMYQNLFIKDTPEFECSNLSVENDSQPLKELLVKRQEPEEEDFHWDYEYSYTPNSILSSKIFVVDVEGIWKIRHVAITRYYSIEK